MKKLGMVIVNYNDSTTTKRLINNVKDYKCLDKIVIVDNCSTDDSYEELKKVKIKNIDIIKTDKNKGYAYGLNYGAKYLLKKYNDIVIIFSNSDVIIKQEKDLIKLKNDINDKVKVVGPTIEEQGHYNRGWKMTTPTIEVLCNLPLISRILKKKKLFYKDDYYTGDKTYVDVVSGCIFLVDGKTLEEIGFFDEKTFLYYEEFILSYKVKKCGKKAIIDNSVLIIHDHSVSIDKSIKRVGKYKILKQSQKYFVEKYLKANKLEKGLLFITNKISLGILYIRCFIKL